MRTATKALIAVIMVLATITSASATINITGAYYEIKKLGDDVVAIAGVSGAYDGYLLYYSGSGFLKAINTSPYEPYDIIRKGVQATPDTIFYDERDLYYYGGSQIVKVDYVDETLYYENISGQTPPAYVGRARLTGITGDGVSKIDALISYQSTYGWSPKLWLVKDISGTPNGSYIGGGGCTTNGGAWGSSGTTYYYCGETIYDTDGDDILYYTPYYSKYNNDFSLYMRGFRFNGTSTSGLGSKFIDAWGGDQLGNLPQTGLFCYEEDDELDGNIVCCRGRTNDCYSFVKNNISGSGTSLGVINIGGTNIEPKFLESSNDGYDKIWVDENNTLKYAYGATITNASIGGVYPTQFSNRILNGSIIYFTSGTKGYISSFAELGSVTVNDTEQETYNNATTIETYNLSGITSLELIGSNQSLVGIDEELTLYDYNDPSSIIILDSVDTGHNIYSTSTYSSNVMAGTNNGIYTYDLATLTQQYNDKWGLFHSDRAYDVTTLSDTSAWVCDNNQEPDYYSVGNDPEGNLGTGCYDLETDHSELYLFVDTEDDGILSIDISNSTNPSIDDSIDLINERYDQSYGDLMDYLDTGDEDLLLVINDYLEFTTIDTTIKSSLSEGTTCNSAGAGQITAVEFIDEETAIAGTHNGRILFCDLTNPDYQTNTEWYTINGIEGEEVRAIEYDGEFIHAISENHYVIMSYEEEEILTNEPPYIDTFSVSDYNPDTGQTVVIDIVAGGEEPEDVIRYGVKCNGTEAEYTTNLGGSFNCEYGVSGTYYAQIAVTDNYHYGSWYDEKILEITVTPYNFTGGIITVEVSDPTSEEYVVGAVVEADNQTANTNTFGRATITTTEPISYPVTITKTGYQTKVVSLTANGDVNYIQLIPTADENQTGLLVTITDDVANPIEGALVSYTHTTTYDYDYTFTDANGQAYFLNIDAGSISLQASASNYDDVQALVTINSYGTTTKTIILPLLSEAYLGSLHDDRDCIDNGIWLCGDSNVVEHSCTEDSDCLGDFCNRATKRCSRFNYSVCDENDMARDQRCVSKYTFEAGMGGVTNFMLSNLLWIVILLIILVGAGLVFFSWNK